MTTPAAKLSKERLIEIISAHLTSMYACTRVWSAWNVGTMGQDDFVEAAETEFPGELADAILSALTPVDELREGPSDERVRELRDRQYTPVLNTPRPTIEELEKILQREDVRVEIMPSGEVRAVDDTDRLLIVAICDELLRLRALSAAKPVDPVEREIEPSWVDVETSPIPTDGHVDVFSGRIYAECYYDQICDEWRRLDRWNRLEMIPRRVITHWRRTALPAPFASIRAGEKHE
jgi:hypothetical protein